MLAVKYFVLKNSPNKNWINNCLKIEMMISHKLKHPNIIFTLEAHKTKSSAILVMEFAENGTMQTDLYTRRGKSYSDDECRTLFKGLMTGLNHMHEHNIAHRDLKLENFLLSKSNVPMLSDFGFAAEGAKTMIQNSIMRGTKCGTAGYMSPELMMLKKGQKYDAKTVDIFAMGVCLYEMLQMKKPFENETVVKLYKFSFESNVTQGARSLINSMLSKVPNERPNTQAVLKNRWVNNSFLNALNEY